MMSYYLASILHYKLLLCSRVGRSKASAGLYSPYSTVFSVVCA